MLPYDSEPDREDNGGKVIDAESGIMSTQEDHC